MIEYVPSNNVPMYDVFSHVSGGRWCGWRNASHELAKQAGSDNLVDFLASIIFRWSIFVGKEANNGRRSQRTCVLFL